MWSHHMVKCIPEAVSMILPPLRSLPRDGLVFIIISDAYFTAKKHLMESDY